METTTDRIEVDLSADYIDVRDIIARVEQLEPLRQPGPVDLGNDEDNEAPQDELFAELATLESVLADLAGNGGDEKWRDVWYPVSLIRESYFEDYARELAEDIGAIDRNASWPNQHIDWEAAAEALLIDYTSTEIEGVTYYFR
jgi:hypothetical protein